MYKVSFSCEIYKLLFYKDCVVYFKFLTLNNNLPVETIKNLQNTKIVSLY